MPPPSSEPTSDLVAELERTTLFGGLERESLARLCRHLDSRWLEAGEVLFHRSDTDGALYVVLEGRLEASRLGEDGRREVLGTIERGEPAGEIQVLTGGERTADVRALGPARVARLPGETADWLAEREPEVLRQLLETIQHRLRHNQMVALAGELFGLRDPEVLREFEQQVEWVKLAAGEPLFRQGEPGECLWIVVSGLLVAVLEGEDKPAEIIGEVGRGELLGEVAIISGEPRAASSYAVRDCELVRIDRELFERLYERDRLILVETARRVVRRARRTLQSEPRRTTLNIALVPCSPEVPLGEVAAGLSAALAEHGATLHLSAERLDGMLASAGAARTPPEDPRSLRLSSWLEEQETRHRFVLLESDREDSAWTRRCVQQAQQVLLVANAGPVAPASAVEAALPAATSRLAAARRILVLVHPTDATQPASSSGWLASRAPTEHHHVRRGRRADYERLARFLGDRAIGLALGGGGARGFAHFGIFLALREAGVPIDLIGGTSMGAVIGAQCALGWDRETMVRANREGLIRKQPFKEYTLPLFSLVSSRKLDRVLQEAYGDTTIEDLWLRFFCVSSNLSLNETMVHDRGSLWRALRASSALPGIVLPVVAREGLLVDGGLVNNLPGDLVRKACSTVIVVNVGSGQEIQGHYGRFPSPWQVLMARLMPFSEAPQAPNILDVLMGSTMLSSAGRTQQVLADADLCLEPPIEEYGLLEFSALEQLIDLGQRYASERIARWLEERPRPWRTEPA